MKLTFPKKERLNSKKTIDRLFLEGKNFSAFPLVVKYEFSPASDEHKPLVQIAISVPKKKAKLAVDRNRLKRQLREAYRLNKSPLLEKVNKSNQRLALFLIYNGGETEDYHLLETKLKVLLNKVENLIQ
jgi:ribonuclease P protein component